jgi:ABC-type thiamine transport system substrate-binding protein
MAGGTYKLAADGHMYTNGQPTGLTAAFLDYMLGPDVQGTLIPSLSYAPVVQVDPLPAPGPAVTSGARSIPVSRPLDRVEAAPMAQLTNTYRVAGLRATPSLRERIDLPRRVVFRGGAS